MTTASAADAAATPWTVDPDADSIEDTPPDLPEDQEALSPAEARSALVFRARRRNTHLRRSSVQLPRSAGDDRLGPLMRMVNDRRALALQLYLLLIGLEPIDGPDDRITGLTWARLLSTSDQDRSPTTVSRTWAYLEDLKLVRREGGRIIRLREDGSGKPYSRPGTDPGPIGYFSLPRNFWIDEWDQKLKLPGIAMLLILLSETNQKPLISYTVDQFANYYGISTSTVDRGLQELQRHGLVDKKAHWVAAERSGIGRTLVTSWWLKKPFSTAYREATRAMDINDQAARGRGAAAAAAAADDTTPEAQDPQPADSTETQTNDAASPGADLSTEPAS